MIYQAQKVEHQMGWDKYSCISASDKLEAAHKD